MIRVGLYTNAPVLAAGLSTVLTSVDGIEAVVISGNVVDVLGQVGEMQPDVLLIDVTPEFRPGLIAELLRCCPGCKIVLWVQSISIEVAHQAKAQGVTGILRKDLANDLLVRCLAKVSEGELWFERSLLNSLLGVKEVNLSPRERQLLKLIAQGLSNKQIASTLSIAEDTVKVYLSKLFRKLGVNDRFELALYGLRNLGTGSFEFIDQESRDNTFPRSLFIRNPIRQ